MGVLLSRRKTFVEIVPEVIETGLIINANTKSICFTNNLLLLIEKIPLLWPIYALRVNSRNGYRMHRHFFFIVFLRLNNLYPCIKFCLISQGKTLRKWHGKYAVTALPHLHNRLHCLLLIQLGVDFSYRCGPMTKDSSCSFQPELFTQERRCVMPELVRVPVLRGRPF